MTRRWTVPASSRSTWSMFLLGYIALLVMLDLCEDRARCAVRASPETFTQDPCQDTSKYLEVHYKCRPNEFESQTVCEGQEMKISCTKGDKIAVYSAMFGRSPNGSDQCPANKQGYIDCQDPGAVTEVRNKCQSKKMCRIQANESIFDNPCTVGIQKYLTVSYACVPRNILKDVPKKSTPKKKKKKKKKDRVTKVTTQTSETTSSQPAHDNISVSSFPNVYETYEQTVVTQNSLQKDPDEHDSDVKTVENTTAKDDIHPAPVMTTEPAVEEVSVVNEGGQEVYYKNTDDITTSDILSQNIKETKEEEVFHDGDKGVDEDGKETVDDVISQVNKETGSRDVQDTKGDHSKFAREDNHNLSLPTNYVSVPTTVVPSLLTNKVQGSTSAPASKQDLPPTYVTERNLTVLCVNYTKPVVRWAGPGRSKGDNFIGFLKDWFSIYHYLKIHQEKAILYFTLGVAFGIIVILVVVLIKVCCNFRRNIRARLDVSEPTHRSAHINNHSSLDAPMLEHSDSMDRIEVVRFSPRNTLRSLRSNSHNRDLVNYYG
ncbi:uncharacterized protein LOC131952683 isoform X2 [Physella acuta]|uniref:uncharacterized protein LOC131952683 isoform X2 n=1 Tax=Physella acuta TaxID=109671 RepID=UPI0027DE3B0C|nr:uncharacterized protein LOC131952683 isoform X2 [Physella acuta]